MVPYLLNPQTTRLVKNRGCTETQILLLTQRVVELTRHLQTHQRDYAAIRGLKKILGQRRRLLLYLGIQDPWKQTLMLSFLKNLNT
jgi:ribosomal protein S15